MLLFLTNLGMGGSNVQVPAVTIRENIAYEVYIKQANGVWEHTQIVFTGADFGVVR